MITTESVLRKLVHEKWEAVKYHSYKGYGLRASQGSEASFNFARAEYNIAANLLYHELEKKRVEKLLVEYTVSLCHDCHSKERWGEECEV